jgi:ABC-type Fe3+-hydroxamate transport system substrate-binding protein
VHCFLLRYNLSNIKKEGLVMAKNKFLFILAAASLLSLAACGNANNSSSAASESSTSAKASFVESTPLRVPHPLALRVSLETSTSEGLGPQALQFSTMTNKAIAFPAMKAPARTS